MLRIVSGHVRVSRHRVHYLEAGTGPLVVLLPSMLVMARSYAPLIRRLAASFHVVAPELPGSGLSSGLSRPLSFEAYADLALAFADTLKLESGVWIGHSNSGPVALYVAQRAPERVRRCVVVDSIGAYPGDSVPWVLARRAVDALLEPRLTLRGAPHVLWNLVRHRRSFFSQVRAATRWSLESIDAPIRSPLLLAWGTRDATEPSSCAQAFARRFPQAQVAFGRGSHDWLIESSREFVGVFRAYATSPG